MTGTIPENATKQAPDFQDELTWYLQQIRSYPLLTAQQERELAMACATGDKTAIRTMVNCNLRLVVSIAKEYANRGVPLMDLIQEGSIGLLTAAKKFDYTKNTRFSTYASPWIRQGINNCILTNSGVIRVARHTMEKMKKILAAVSTIEQEGLEPDHEELSLRTGIPADKIGELLELIPKVGSLDAPAGDPDHDSLQTILPDTQTLQPQEELVRQELSHTMELLLSALNPRQRQILRLRFGMESDTCHSLAEIGKILGISKERARQLEQQALAKLRELGADLGLEDFLQ